MYLLIALCLPFQQIPASQTQEKENAVSSSSSKPLNQETIDEIRKIRERVGIKLFKGQKNGEEFEKQLQKIHKTEQSGSLPRTAKKDHRVTGERVIERPFAEWLSSRNSKGEPGKTGGPVVEPMAKSNVLSHSALKKTSYTDTLFQTVANLDQSALELEKLGEFEKSARLRKLSRKIRKQIRDIVNPRDN